MIKFEKDEFLKPQIYSTNDERETRCNVTKEIVDDVKQLEQENQKYKEVIDKAKEIIESKNNGVCVINEKEKEAFTFLLDFDKAREFIWKLLDILKEVE